MTRRGVRGCFGHLGRFALAAVALAVVSVSPAVAGAPEIARVDANAKPLERGKYPPEMVAGPKGFDGSLVTAPGYASKDGKLVVAIWESGPGILRTDSYPHHEFCRVLEGKLVITNASGTKAEFGPGDTFVIPKGWAGTWDMKSRFKKQYVAAEEVAPPPLVK